jgi:alpha-1,6-mannosyltransferase
VNELGSATAHNTVLGTKELGNQAQLWMLAATGVAAIALTFLTLLAFRHAGDNGYMVAAVASGLVALTAAGIAERTSGLRAVMIIAGVALLLRAIALSLDPLLSSDIYRYIWDGRVQAAGINPYRYAPADQALAALRDAAIFPNINRAEYALTIYPPVAQMFFFLVTRLGENVTTMRAAMLGCEAGLVILIGLLLNRLGLPVTRVVAYAWHPLPVWEVANNGHVDVLMVALMMLGIWLAVMGRPLQGAASIVLGALAKPFAIVTLPVVWRPWDWRPPLVAIAIAGLCYLPYLPAGWNVFGFLTAGYLTEEGIASGDNIWPLAVWRVLFGRLPMDAIIYFVIAGAAIAALALRMAFRQAPPAEKLADIKLLLLAFLFLLSPNYPWYFLIVTPFLALGGGAPAWTMTIGAVLLQEEAWWDYTVPILIRKSVLFGAFLVACAYSIWNSRRTPDGRPLSP